MSIISAIIGSVAASGGPSKTANWYGIDFEPVQEGQQQHAQVQFTNWDNSTVYWTVVGSLNSYIGGQLVSYNGTLNPGSGNSIQDIYFTFNADQTTDGPLTYYVNIGSTVGNYDLALGGSFTCRDSSQSPALVLDVDPASLVTMFGGLTGWYDASGQGNNLSISNGSTSTDNGGTLVFNGTSTYAGDIMNANLTSSVYGTITLSAWIKPDVVTGLTQAIIAKELCYKLEITTNGSIAWMTGKGYNTWEVTVYANPGLVTTSTWSNIVATVDADYTRIYVNGVKITETSGNIIGANSHAFNIGAYDTTNDLFGGRMGEIKVWNYAITEAAVISQYNSTAARYGQSPIPFSLVFNQPEGDYLSTPASSDWNLGTTYTIEFWINANNASGAGIHIPGGQWGLINQTGWYGGMQNNSMLIGMTAGNLTIAQDSDNDIQFAEPTAGVWTHVALVNNGGGSAQKVYYNGVEQTKTSGSYQSNGWTNTTADLYIGRLAPNYASHFDGKMAMVRISNTAKYLAPFTATTTYGVESDTVLFLGKANPLVDSKSHTITNNGVALISDVPTVTEFVFQNVGFNYSVDGILGYFPTLNLVRGHIYYFNLTNVMSGHPLAFRVSSGATLNIPGMIGNDPVGGHYGNNSIPTIVVYQIPLDAPSIIYYQCVYHAGMIGSISITN